MDILFLREECYSPHRTSPGIPKRVTSLVASPPFLCKSKLISPVCRFVVGCPDLLPVTGSFHSFLPLIEDKKERRQPRLLAQSTLNKYIYICVCVCVCVCVCIYIYLYIYKISLVCPSVLSTGDACVILAPPAVGQPVAPGLEGWSPNHWTPGKSLA